MENQIVLNIAFYLFNKKMFYSKSIIFKKKSLKWVWKIKFNEIYWCG